jgi:hypothetical protein
MTTRGDGEPSESPAIPNGSGAAAALAAGIGAFTLAVLAVAGDKSAWMNRCLNFYSPTGPLSGATTIAILVWILIWGVLEWRWRGRNVAAGYVNATAFLLLGLSLLMTFPPVADLF